MNTAHYDFPLVSLNGKLYAIGGRSGVLNQATQKIEGAIEEYNPGTDSWTTKITSQSLYMYNMAAVGATDGYIYIFGGRDGNNNGGFSSSILYNTVWRYNPANNELINMATMGVTLPVDSGTTGRQGCEAICIDRKIYVIGGFTATDPYKPIPEYNACARVDIYDIDKRTWSTGANLPRPLGAFGIAGGSDSIYVIGGNDFYTNNANPELK